MAPSKTSKSPTTLAITKNDGSVVRVKRSTLKDIKLLIELQESLLSTYIEEGGDGFAEMLLDDDFYSQVSTFISLIPLSDGSGNLKLEDIDEDWTQLQQLIFNGSYSSDDTLTSLVSMSPSLFSKLNFLPFTKVASPMLQTWIKVNREKYRDMSGESEQSPTPSTES